MKIDARFDFNRSTIVFAVKAALQSARLSMGRHPVATQRPFMPLWIDPSEIRWNLPSKALDLMEIPTHFVVKRGFNGKGLDPVFSAGYFWNGPWFDHCDHYNPKESRLYQAMVGRFIHNEDWSNTEFIATVRENIRIYGRDWNGARSHADIQDRIDRLERLHASIIKYGLTHTYPPVCCLMGPSGEIVKHGNGQHRLMLALITNKRLPVHIIAYHPESVRAVRQRRCR